MPLRGVNGRSLLHFIPFPRVHVEDAGEEAENGGPTTRAKLIVPLGLAASCVAHLALLTPVVILAGGNPFDPAPPQAITVDIVSPDEIPQSANEPAPTETTASEPASASTPEPPAAAARQLVMTSPPTAPQPAPPHPDPDPHATSPALAAPPAMLPPPPSIPPPPPPAEASQPEEPAEPAASPFGMPLTMPDGTLGGRFNSQAVDRADITNDAVAAFRSHLKTCSTLPAGVAPAVRVVLRIHLNPDGTLAAGLPQNPEPVRVEGVSVGGGALFQNAIAALRKCQPFKMLPPDRYQEWKTLDITFTPQNF